MPRLVRLPVTTLFFYLTQRPIPVTYIVHDPSGGVSGFSVPMGYMDLTSIQSFVFFFSLFVNRLFFKIRIVLFE